MRPGRERRRVTAALMLAMFLAALEATAVGTAMPTAVGELGGVARYSWVFSAYLLTSTTTVPLYGKLADLHGRALIFYGSVALFLTGSALSGLAGSIEQLIVFRAVQGLGAGGVMPIAITLVGDIYTLEERGRMQGLFSGVWGVSSLVGPAVGGLVTDLVSWRWVFYLNLPFGLLSVALLALHLREDPERERRRLDLLGTLSLTAAITLLLVALLEGGEVWGWASPRTLALIGGATTALVVFIAQERRAPEPMLPLDLFGDRIIAVSSAGSVLIGTLLFASTAFVPMFVQGVLGGTAVDAGIVLAPMSIGWPIASTASGRLLLRIGYRPLPIAGGVFALAGSALLAQADPATSRATLMAAMFVLGLGLGCMSTPYLVAVQNAVPWRRRGVATSVIQFSRTIGGAITVAAFGAILNAHIAARLGPDAVDPDAALDPALRATLAADSLAALIAALADGLHAVYTIFLALALAAVLIAILFPSGAAESHAYADDQP